MALLKIVWTRLAIADLGSAYDYIAAVNPESAPSVVERIEKAVAALQLNPSMGRPGRVSGTRELVVTRTPFIVPYRVLRERIEILAVIHAARRWPNNFPE